MSGRKNPLSVFFNIPFVILEFLLHMLYIHRTYDHTDIKSVGSNTPGNWLLLHKTLAAIYICIHWLLGIHTCRQGTQTRSKQKAKLWHPRVHEAQDSMGPSAQLGGFAPDQVKMAIQQSHDVDLNNYAQVNAIQTLTKQNI